MNAEARSAPALEPLAELANLLFANALRTVAAGEATGEPLRDAQALVRSWVDGLQSRLGAIVPDAAVGSVLTPVVQAFAALPALQGGTPPDADLAAALRPVALNLERTYGGLADAFGLAPLRELQQAASAMTAASLERRRAQADYLAVVAAALGRGAETMAGRLDAMARRGESVESLLDLLRLWARATDEAMHAALQSPAALQASAGLIRASTRQKRAEQRVVALVSEALNVPTRAEVDEAYREIQVLKRELRRWRKAGPAADATAVNGAARRTTSARRRQAVDRHPAPAADI